MARDTERETGRKRGREGRGSEGFKLLGKREIDSPPLGISYCHAPQFFFSAPNSKIEWLAFILNIDQWLVKRNINQADIPCFPIRTMSVLLPQGLSLSTLSIRTKRALGQLIS